MKNLLFAFFLTLNALTAFSQDKKEPDTKNAEKPKYAYTVTLPAETYQALANFYFAGNNFVIWSPAISDKELRQLLINMQQTINKLPGQIKLDSVRIDNPEQKTLKKQ